jgi:hypothetical protein
MSPRQRELLRVLGINGRHFSAYPASVLGRPVRDRECEERHTHARDNADRRRFHDSLLSNLSEILTPMAVSILRVVLFRRGRQTASLDVAFTECLGLRKSARCEGDLERSLLFSPNI